MIKRFLIVDDSFPAEIATNNFFQNCGVDVEVRIARTTEEAIEIVDEWAALNHRPDILSCDDNYYGHGDYASYVLDHVLQHLEEKGPEYMPEAFFVHSASPRGPLETKWGQALSYDKGELFHIEDWATNDMLDYAISCEDGRNSFKRYLNENWGTTFPISEASLKLIKQQVTEVDEGLKRWELMQAVSDGEMSIEEAFYHLNPAAGEFISSPQLEEFEDGEYIGEDVRLEDAIPGSVSGKLVFNANDIERLRKDNHDETCILAMDDYDPSLLPILKHVNGVICLGNGSEHLKIILENFGIPGVFRFSEDGIPANFGKISIENSKMIADDYVCGTEEEAKDKGRILKAGDDISITSSHYTSFGPEGESKGYNGNIYFRAMKVVSYDHKNEDEIEWLTQADKLRHAHSRLSVKANADNAEQVKKAIQNGAEAIGLCRTENMITSRERLDVIQDIMLAESGRDLTIPLKAFSSYHICEFLEIFEAANNDGNPVPVRIRLLDALPDEVLTKEQAEQFRQRVSSENERGVQFALQTPGLYEAQIHAIFDAAQDTDYSLPPEILVPTVVSEEELLRVKAMVEEVAQGRPYRFGSMIENTIASYICGELAKHCDFVNFGTNDLMKDIMGGVDRHDHEAMIDWVIEAGQAGKNPFRLFTKHLLHEFRSAVGRLYLSEPEVEICACGDQFAHDVAGAKLAVQSHVHSVSIPQGFVKQMRVNTAHFITHARLIDAKPSPIKSFEQPYDAYDLQKF